MSERRRLRRRGRGDDLVKSKVGWKTDHWAGFSPNGIGEQKPNHYGAMLRTVWDNRRALPYATRILRKGVCDGCALGVAGFHDWTISGVHLCTTRLDLLKVNTARAIPPERFADVAALQRMNGRELRELGRLPYPMVRKRGDRGFTRVSWDHALDLVAARIRATTPDRTGVYLTARGITNEVYYVAQKAARFIGTNNVDNAARVCHAPSTAALKEATGVAATTCSYRDVIESDLVVLFGADVANAQPVFMKYLYLAKQRGAKVAVVNPLREPGLERYWVPSNVESALFGTRITDDFFTIHTGGDVAFVNGVLKQLLANGGIDRAFVNAHTDGFDALLAELESEPYDRLEAASGATREDMARFARMYAGANSAVLVWSMGVTQHVSGVDNVKAIVNLGLARGNVGRPGAGLMPIRGHSGVQGGAEMGCYATTLPGGGPVTPAAAAELGSTWGFDVPDTRGLTAAEMVEAARLGTLDVLWSSGGNFLDVLPAPDVTRAALERAPMRVHQDIVLSHQMLVEPGEVVVLLPVATRYEQEGGGTTTTTERRVAFSPEIPGPRVGEARSEWRIFADIARRVRPDAADRFGCGTGDAIREEIARVIPAYAGIEHLGATGDAIQIGGERLCEGGKFPTADGRARFSVVPVQEREVPDGKFVLSTRRGKQFNSMVWKDVDPLTGAARDALFLAADDATALGVREGTPVLVRSAYGEMRARVHVAPIRPGNVQAFFPEANVLIAPARRDPVSGIPDYNAVVEVVALSDRREAAIPPSGERGPGGPAHSAESGTGA
jgi:molybdopterin-dependent oxidoreductase alpha subunit